MVALLRPPLQEVRTPVLDSQRWARFEPRADDIVIATFPKSGTTWMQRIVDLLVFLTPDVRPVGTISPWLDCTFFEALDGLRHATSIKRHQRRSAGVDTLFWLRAERSGWLTPHVQYEPTVGSLVQSVMV